MKVEFIFAQMATAVAIATLGLSSAVADALGESITTPSEDSVLGVAVNACVSGGGNNRNAPDFQRDCDNLLVPILGEGEPNPDGVAAITAAAAGVPSSASLNNTQAVQAAIAGRLAALRQGATGFNLNVAGRGFQRGGAAGDSDFSKLGGFLTGSLGRTNNDGSILEPGYDANNWNLNAGLDYKLLEQLTVGGVLSYARTKPKFDGGQGDLDADSFSILAYGNYFFNDALYMDGVVGYGWNSYDQDRRIRYTAPPTEITEGANVDQTARSSFDGGQALAAIGLGMELHSGGLTYGPIARLQYVDLDVDGYSESMSNPDQDGSGWAVRINDQTYRSTTFSLGGNLSFSSSQSWGVLVPQANLTWIHEFENDTKVVPGFFIGECAGSTGCGAEGSGAFFITTAEPDRDYFSLGLGTSAIFSGGSSAFIALDALLGYKDLSSYRVTLGYRAEF